MKRLHDLAFNIDGDTIDLEQDTGCGNIDRISLHRFHLELLAREAGLVWTPSPTEETLRRRLLVLRARLHKLDAWLNDADRIEAGECEMEGLYARTACELADEFTAGFGEPVVPPDAPAAPNSEQPSGATSPLFG